MSNALRTYSLTQQYFMINDLSITIRELVTYKEKSIGRS